MNLTQITPPTTEPVSLQQAKDHLRLDHDSEDELVARLVSAAPFVSVALVSYCAGRSS